MRATARRAWRRMVMDICIGLFMVVLLALGSGFAVFALYAFAADILPRYAAAALVGLAAFAACGGVYAATVPRSGRRPASPSLGKQSGTEKAEALVRELSKSYSPTVVVALLAGLAAVRPSISRASSGF